MTNARRHGYLRIVSALLWVAGAASGSATMRVQPDPGALRGRVTGTRGEALPQVVVVASPEQGGRSFTTRTDDAGAFVVEGVPSGFYRIVVQLAGFLAKRRIHVPVLNGIDTNIGVVMDVRSLCDCLCAAKARSAPPTLEGRAAPELEGRVVTESGWPVPYSRLEIDDEDGRWLDDGYTNRDGGFAMRLPAQGNWTIRSVEHGFEGSKVAVNRDATVPLALVVRYRDSVVDSSFEDIESCCDCPSLFIAVQPQ